MTWPGSARAVIDPEKIRDYLLSPFHPSGRSKAAFFASLGYRRDSWELLERDLRALAGSDVARSHPPSRHGQKFEVRGTLRSPTGRWAGVVTVWIVRHGESFPRFITAYPA